MSMYCMARTWRLTQRQIGLAERHARRLDPKSQSRQVRNELPVTWVPPGVTTPPLSLPKLYADHVAGAFIPRGKAKAVHMLVLFPDSVPTATRADAEAALQLAVDFVQERFGGNAVFAARMDRDEKSLTNCDLFIAPRYLKETKRQTKEAISLSRHMKQIAERRGTLTDDRDVLRGQGQALQDEFAEFLRGRGYQAIRGQKKLTLGPDWVSPEAYGVSVDRDIAAADRQIAAEDRAEVEGSLAAERAELDAKSSAIVTGLEDAGRVGREIRDTLIDAGRQFVTDADEIKRRAVADAEKAVALAQQEAAAIRDNARLEAEAIIAAARHEADTIAAKIKRRWQAAKRLGGIMRARFNSQVEARVPEAIKARELTVIEAERLARERSAAAAEAQQRAKDRQAELDISEAAIRRDGAQLALLTRALHDPSLALEADTAEHGFRMSVETMADSEREAYRAPWSNVLRAAAASLLDGLRTFRKRNAEATAAVRARELKVAVTERELDLKREAVKNGRQQLDISLQAAANFSAAFAAIPEQERTPPVRAALRKAGIFAQAAELPIIEGKAASKGMTSTATFDPNSGRAGDETSR